MKENGKASGALNSLQEVDPWDVMGDSAAYGLNEDLRDPWDITAMGTPTAYGLPDLVYAQAEPRATFSVQDITKNVMYAGQLYRYITQQDASGRTVYVPRRVASGPAGFLQQIPTWGWLAGGLILFGLLTKR